MQQVARKFKIAILQTPVKRVKSETLQFVRNALEEAGSNGAKVSFLGETFNSVYMKEYCNDAKENFNDPDAPTLKLLKEKSKKYSMCIIGSIPELGDDNNLYNTAIAIDSEGNLAAKHRKVHLFDINMPGKAVYKESDIFSRGDKITIFDAGFCKFGIGICYDIRFAEQALIMTQKLGAQVLSFPANFAMATGTLHWELLLRSRALDNLSYVVGSCCARSTDDTTLYQGWGHSSLVDPFGQIKVKASYEPTILYDEIDLDYQDQIRQQIPIYSQRRTDLYEVVQKEQL